MFGLWEGRQGPQHHTCLLTADGGESGGKRADPGHKGHRKRTQNPCPKELHRGELKPVPKTCNFLQEESHESPASSLLPYGSLLRTIKHHSVCLSNSGFLSFCLPYLNFILVSPAQVFKYRGCSVNKFTRTPHGKVAKRCKRNTEVSRSEERNVIICWRRNHRRLNRRGRF